MFLVIRTLKENVDPQKQVSEKIVVEYVPEQPEFEDGFDDEFRKIFDKFNFRESVDSEEDVKKDESEEKTDVKKKLDSDSDNQQKEKCIANRKKKLRRRMNIAELKQVSARPDVVEIWECFIPCLGCYFSRSKVVGVSEIL